MTLSVTDVFLSQAKAFSCCSCFQKFLFEKNIKRNKNDEGHWDWISCINKSQNLTNAPGLIWNYLVYEKKERMRGEKEWNEKKWRRKGWDEKMMKEKKNEIRKLVKAKRNKLRKSRKKKEWGEEKGGREKE